MENGNINSAQQLEPKKISFGTSRFFILSALKIFLINLSALLPIDSSLYCGGQSGELLLAVLKKPQEEREEEVQEAAVS